MNLKPIPNILIVDDNYSGLLLLEKMLKGINAQIIPTDDGLKALEFCNTIEFALLILDVQMPLINGYELAQKIHNTKANQHTPVIFLSAIYFDQASIFKGYQSGAVDFISQPVKREILRSKVQVFLELDAQKQEILQQKKELQENMETIQQADQERIKAIINTQDKERKRIASDIHDSMGQNLTAASLNFDSLLEDISQLSKKKQEQFHNGIKFLRLAIEESRGIAHNLMPKAVEDFGLVRSLKSLVNDIKKISGLDIFFYENFGKKRIEPSQELHLYRIAQECLQNILKHAKATSVSMQLILHDDDIIFTIEDDGKGLGVPLEESRKQGMGLNNIFNRVMVIAGTVDIESSAKSGTLITIVVPINTNSN